MATKQIGKSLKSRKNPLSESIFQLSVLNNTLSLESSVPSFKNMIKSSGHKNLTPTKLEVLQINMGKRCNQTCSHCHVDAGPDRIENITRELLEQCLKIIALHSIPTVDITGGAPELNQNFRWFVESCAQLGCKIINRCNLTIIVSNPKYHDLPEFFAKHNVHLICSLPYISKGCTDAQRGDGVFEDSIRALKMLNEIGYGVEATDLKLDLVHNPIGAVLPADQHTLEPEFKRELKHQHGISFNQLLVIANLPISRFLDFLIESDKYDQYMHRLVDSFNPKTLDSLMCRNTLSVGWDGYIYDCDFNQMLDLKVETPQHHISDFNMDALSKREIVVNQHCYGCTAGSGSSCGGALV